MSELEDPNLEEEDASKLPEGGESEDELAGLFKEEEAPEGETADEKVARLEATVANLQKGVAKHFSDRGRERKQETPSEIPKETPKSVQNDDVTELFYTTNPKAELVAEQLKTVADKLYGGSILRAWKNEEFLRDKAESLANKKTESEANKAKIGKPAIGKSGGPADYRSISSKEALKLPDDEFAKWSKANQ